jgi:hypothetical protein
MATSKIKPKAKTMPAKKALPLKKKAAPVQRDIEDDDVPTQELVDLLTEVPTQVLMDAVLAEVTRRADACIEAADDTPEEIASLWLHLKATEQTLTNVRRASEDALSLIFPAQDVEGTEDHVVPGFSVKIVHKVTRTVDPEKLTELSEEYEIDDEIARLFRFKPELNLAVFRAEAEDMQELFNNVITTKQARPSFTITAVDEE